MNIIVQLGLAAHKKAQNCNFFLVFSFFAKTIFLMGVRTKFMDFAILGSPIIGAGVEDVE